MIQSVPPCRFEEDVPLSARAYYGIGGRARFMVFPTSPAECAALLRWNRRQSLPLVVLGSGTNTLFSDLDFPGTVLCLEGMQGIRSVGPLELFVEAGVENTVLAEELLRLGITGGEWLYRLPGRIGGTLRMNARCFGGEISSVAAGVHVLSPDGAMRFLKPEELFLGYKETSLMHAPAVVLGALLRFPGHDGPDAIEGRMHAHLEERLRKHHFDFPSCGSVFRNNYDAGRSSGMIFEELGCKSMREGGAAVSRHHANFIFNEGGAQAADVLTLAGRMRAMALERAGVPLELELECVGRFPKALLEQCGVACTPDPEEPEMAWVGLFERPGAAQEQTRHPMPRTVLEGPLSAYPAPSMAFPPGVAVRIEQLRSLSKAPLDPDGPFLKWSTASPLPREFRTPPSTGAGDSSFMDGLWEYGVSELFIGGGGGSGPYLEFEASPAGRWLAIRFDGPRRRAAGHDRPAEELWEGVGTDFAADGISMTFSYRLLEPFIERLPEGGGLLPLQCAASSGTGRLGQLPWWNDAPEPPDFHCPERFFPAGLV